MSTNPEKPIDKEQPADAGVPDVPASDAESLPATDAVKIEELEKSFDQPESSSPAPESSSVVPDATPAQEQVQVQVQEDAIDPEILAAVRGSTRERLIRILGACALVVAATTGMYFMLRDDKSSDAIQHFLDRMPKRDASTNPDAMPQEPRAAGIVLASGLDSGIVDTGTAATGLDSGVVGTTTATTGLQIKCAVAVGPKELGRVNLTWTCLDPNGKGVDPDITQGPDFTGATKCARGDDGVSITCSEVAGSLKLNDGRVCTLEKDIASLPPNSSTSFEQVKVSCQK